MLKTSGAQLAVKTFAAAVAIAAAGIAVSPAASASTLAGRTSIAWGTQSTAQFSAQSQCFDWGYKNASNAVLTWDDSRNAWKATVQCS